MHLVKSVCKCYVTTSEFQWKKLMLSSESKMVARGPVTPALGNRRKEEIGFQRNYRGAKTNF